MSTICQPLYTFGEEVYFTRMWDFTWSVSNCEEIVGQLPSPLLIPQFSTTISVD